jgi:hypothetical protein
MDIECINETKNGKRYARYQLRRPYGSA